MVNRYIGSPSDTGASTQTSVKRSIGDATSRDPDSTTVLERYRTPSIIDPAQFQASSRPNPSARDAATTTIEQNTQFNAPSSFAGIGLNELESLYQDLNRIAVTPPWRDNAQAAITKLRKLLPSDPPPAYQLLAWACDQFVAFTRSGSRSDSTALNDILDALQTLIRDAQPQTYQQASAHPLENTSPLPSKRRRPDDSASASQGDGVLQPSSDDTVSRLEGCLQELEEIPLDAEDWTDIARPITRRILAALEDDTQIDLLRHVQDACSVFDLLDSKVVGNDLMNELRKALEQHEKSTIAVQADSPDTPPTTASTVPKEPLAATAPQTAVATAAMDLVLESAAEAAVFDILRQHPTLIRKDLQEHPDLSKFSVTTIGAAASSFRSRMAFGLPIEKFILVLRRVAKSDSADGFIRNLARKERLGLSADLFRGLKEALRRYQIDHEGALPANEAEAASLVKHLPRNPTNAAIWLAATCRDPSSMRRDDALRDWNNSEPADMTATQAADSRTAPPASASSSRSGRPLTVKEAISRTPWLSNKKLKILLPELGSYRIRTESQFRDTIAYGLQDLEMIQTVVKAADSAETADAFQNFLGKHGIAMNRLAFPDWKIAWAAYKLAHENATPRSAKELKEFANCIQPSPTAAAVYWAVCGQADYCQPLHVAIEDWQKREPDKFKTEGDPNPPRPSSS